MNSTPAKVTEYDRAAAAGSEGGGAFSPSAGQAARQVTADVADDLKGCTDRLAYSFKRTSLVRNGCCPGGPEHWMSHVIFCPAVKVSEQSRNPGMKRHTQLMPTGTCSDTNSYSLG